MERDELLNFVAPCSLLCYTCTGFKDGPVTECAKKLYTYLNGFGEMRGTNMQPREREEWLAEFEKFHNTLQYVGGVCGGCREGRGSGCIEGCVIPDCVKERGVDFCAQCSEFPCEKAAEFFKTCGGAVRSAWESGSVRLKEVGLENYFQEKKIVSHYIHYKQSKEG